MGSPFRKAPTRAVAAGAFGLIRHHRKTTMSLGTILLSVLILLLLGALPSWPHSRSWGYYPSSGLGLVLIILIVLMLTNRV